MLTDIGMATEECRQKPEVACKTQNAFNVTLWLIPENAGQPAAGTSSTHSKSIHLGLSERTGTLTLKHGGLWLLRRQRQHSIRNKGLASDLTTSDMAACSLSCHEPLLSGYEQISGELGASRVSAWNQ